MDATPEARRIVVVGDPADETVGRIVAAIPRPTQLLACPGTLPETWPFAVGNVDVLVVHRAVLSSHDLVRLSRFVGREPGRPRVFLCVGALARYQSLERWVAVCDRVFFEATTPEVIARHVVTGLPDEAPSARPGDGARSAPNVSVVSSNYELRLMLADACTRSGFTAHPAADWAHVAGTPLAVWDVPVLDESWPASLRRESRRRRIVTLAGFCDRSLVTAFYANGARGCLELPCDPDDLAWVLDRVSAEDATQYLAHPAHLAPPPANLSAGDRAAAVAARRVRSESSTLQ